MNSGATSERVYAELKRRLLAGEHRPGERLEAAQLGELLISSITPVRDALNTLVGEGLVETRTGDGYRVPPVDAPGLEDLYRWNAEVLTLAARAARPTALARPDPGDPAERTARLFATLARTSPNIEHRRAVATLNDRLHTARHAEALLFEDIDAELDQLAECRAVPPLARAIMRFHTRRIRQAADIVRQLYRAG